jgi:hypothetical protein
MSDCWEQVTRYASNHHGVIGLRAARGLAISKDALQTFERAGRLVRRGPEVYVTAGSPGSWRQRVMVATASSSAWASHRTAAALWDLDGFPQRQIEVLSPYGNGRRREDWLVHQTRRLSGVDLAEAYQIPCTSVARTILDLAAVAHPFQVSQALDDACRRWPGMLDVTAQRFLELARRGRKGTRLMRAMLDERLGRGRFAQSGFETNTLRLVRSVGLPEPMLQHQVRDSDFTAYLDLAWPAVMLGLECDSLAWHSGKRAHEWDRQRRRRLKALGWDLIEVTYDDVTKRRSETGEQIHMLYRNREQRLLFC